MELLFFLTCLNKEHGDLFFSVSSKVVFVWGQSANCPSPQSLHLTLSWGAQRKVRHTLWKFVHSRVKLKFWLRLAEKKPASTSVAAGPMWRRLASRPADDLDLVETGLPRLAESIGGELNGLTTNDGFSSVSRRCRPLTQRQARLIHEESLLKIAVMLNGPCEFMSLIIHLFNLLH